MRMIKKIGEWFDHRLQLAAPIREAAEHPVRETRRVGSTSSAALRSLFSSCSW